MHYDLLRARSRERREHPTIFLFAVSPALIDSGSLTSRTLEELELSPYEYADSSEFSFDESAKRENAIEKLKTALESEGNSVRLLDRIVEVEVDSELNNSLFEESMILH